MENTKIWDYYQRGVDHHNMQNIYAQAKQNYNFYFGDQWNGCKSGNEELPVLNFIKPVCKYKISMIAQNLMSIVYNNISENENDGRICSALTQFAQEQWEKTKMDSLSWEIIKNACVNGDHYLYCYEDSPYKNSVAKKGCPKIKMKSVASTNIYFSDEQNPVIDEQEYIIIAERLPVSLVRQMAKNNKIPTYDIAKITSDDNDETSRFGCEDEVETDLGKCTSILFMQKTKDGIEFCRSVKSLIYEPFKLIKGLNIYPVAGMRWETMPNSARGMGCVKNMIANQLEVNKTAARRAVIVKKFTFPLMVYDNEKVANPEDLSVAGAVIGVENLENTAINSIVDYISPAPLSQDAQILQNELMVMTRELEGASDAAIGQIDPTKASGEAIKAVRDQAAIPLNEQINNYRQLVEDIAFIWFKMWVAYSPYGLDISYNKNGKIKTEKIKTEELLRLEPEIKIDVSPVDPFSRLSREISLERLMQQNLITFEEYVNSLSGNSTVPKNKLQEILNNRKIKAEKTLPPIESINIDEVLAQLN
ncbi:MAG: hypothetical protein RSD67_07065 [Oscillospiraceae bacterium]